jgi:soluble lytic murein transglycosylase-like protein/LysM repeat protein
MWSRKNHFVLLLAVSGIFGCASTERLHQRTVTSTVPTPQPKPPANNISQGTADPSPQNSPTGAADQPVVQETRPLAVALETQPTVLTSPTEQKPERPDSREKSAQPTNPSSPAQAQRNLGADNRLLDLMEKDLDKAVEQPKERRRLQFSKEVVDNPQVRHFVKYYSTTGKARFQQLLARSGRYMPMIAKVLNEEGLPEELGYLALIESEFVVNRTSRNGAVGLWQFIATTARRYGLRIDDWVDERRDPAKSTRAAAAYLKDLHRYYGRWFLATAAYNAGPGTIDKAMQQSGAKDFWSIKAKAQLSEETRNFVPKLVAISLIATDPQNYGFNDVRYDMPLDYEDVELVAPIKLDALADLAETDLAVIRDLNPALRGHTTPPGEHGYRINFPKGKGAIFLAKINEKLPQKESDQTRVVTHEVKKGDTLFSIARRYGQDVRALMEFNRLTTSHLRIGQKLRILLEGLRGKLR